MAKLWAKGYDLDKLIEEFTVGVDYRLDREIAVADCMGSVAHARMLETIGILTPGERGALEDELRRYAVEAVEGKFRISRDEEDCHSAIENRLTAALGETGKKIHTGRSRNDQVLTALRLVERSFLLHWVDAMVSLVRCLSDFAERERYSPMPGRTHLQPAMPSSVGLWAAAYSGRLVDQLVVADAVYALIDRSPLGSAAGYGVPLPIDRELTARLMGFSEVHTNVIAAANSRGELDAWLLSLLDHTGLILSRFAEDIILFSLPEFGFFSLPPELCSGSSIMPQKRNPDALELMRARSATLSGYASQVGSVVRSLPGGYNRDLQETKEPVLRGMRGGLLMVRVAERIVARLAVDRDRLAAAFTPEIFATDAAFELVAKGASFRDAYREVAQRLDELSDRDPVQMLKRRTHAGTATHHDFDAALGRAMSLSERFDERRERVRRAVVDLLGDELPVYLARDPT